MFPFPVPSRFWFAPSAQGLGVYNARFLGILKPISPSSGSSRSTPVPMVALILRFWLFFPLSFVIVQVRTVPLQSFFGELD